MLKVPADVARRLMARACTEAALQRLVVQAAERLGWLVYHTHDSRRSQGGKPDLELVHPVRLLFLQAELKTATGKLTRDRLEIRGARQVFIRGQFEFMAALVGAGVPVYLWRPADWFDGRVLRVLQGDLAIDLRWTPAQDLGKLEKISHRK